MKTLKKALSLLMALAVICTIPLSASAVARFYQRIDILEAGLRGRDPVLDKLLIGEPLVFTDLDRFRNGNRNGSSVFL